MKQKALIIGCGDIGVRVARLLQAGGYQVSGLARSEESAKRLRRFGIEPVNGDLDDPRSLTDLPTQGQLVYYFAPPPGGGPIDSRMRTFCDTLSCNLAPQKVVYMSTSGVYGDCGAGFSEPAARY